MPLEYGSVTPSAAAVAMAASAALPPRRSTSIPTAVASGSTLATAPPVPVASGCRGGVAAFAATAGWIDAATPVDAQTRSAIRGIARLTAPKVLRTDLGIVTSVGIALNAYSGHITCERHPARLGQARP